MVGKEDRLCLLEVSIARDNEVFVLFCLREEGLLRGADRSGNAANFFSQVEPLIEGNLVVPAAGGMKFSADIPHSLDQSLLDSHVDVLGDEPAGSATRA